MAASCCCTFSNSGAVGAVGIASEIGLSSRFSDCRVCGERRGIRKTMRGLRFLNFKSLQIEMGEVDAKRKRVTRHELRHDLHTVSLLTDYLVFSPKYRGKVLLGNVAEVVEENIRETCKERDIEVIDMVVNVDS